MGVTDIPFLRRVLDPLALRLRGAGLSALALALVSLTAGLAATAAIVVGANGAAAGLLAVSRIGFALAAGPGFQPDDRTASALAVFDTLALTSLPFGFALADLSHGPAAAFLVLALAVEGVAAAARPRSIALPAVFKAMASLGLIAAVLFPNWFGVAAYGIGIAGFVAAGVSVARLLTDRET